VEKRPVTNDESNQQVQKQYNRGCSAVAGPQDCSCNRVNDYISKNQQGKTVELPGKGYHQLENCQSEVNGGGIPYNLERIFSVPDFGEHGST
jgi:hypothetical protein